MPNRERLVYGVDGDNIILLPESIAQTYATDHQAFFSFKTYGEARRYEPLGINPVPGLDTEDLDDDEIPGDDDPYDVRTTAECENGDWPPPAATIALESLPDEIADIGTQDENIPFFPTLRIDPSTEQELLTTLRERGYEVFRDDNLIRQI